MAEPRKFVTSVEVDGDVTTDGVIATGGGTATSMFLTNGTTSEVDSWSTNEW